MQGNRGEIVLMDAAGKPLLTIRRKVINQLIISFDYIYSSRLDYNYVLMNRD